MCRGVGTCMAVCCKRADPADATTSADLIVHTARAGLRGAGLDSAGAQRAVEERRRRLQQLYSELRGGR